MAYDPEEQEQIASIKAWWNQYGNIATWLLILSLTAYAGWTGWKYYQQNQSVQASQLYDALQKAVQLKDDVKVQRAALDMQAKFSNTAYAQMAALAAAKSSFDANNMKSAKIHLSWVINNGIHIEYKAIAKIRLAGVLLDEKSYDEALKWLEGEFPVEFQSISADRKGDIFVALTKFDQAREQYRMAVEKSETSDPGRQLIQLKLDALGGGLTKSLS